MKYLPSVLTDTLEMLEPKELAILVKEFLVSLPPDRLVKQKMDCIKDIVRGELFRRRGNLIFQNYLKKISGMPGAVSTYVLLFRVEIGLPPLQSIPMYRLGFHPSDSLGGKAESTTSLMQHLENYPI